MGLRVPAAVVPSAGPFDPEHCEHVYTSGMRSLYGGPRPRLRVVRPRYRLAQQSTLDVTLRIMRTDGTCFVIGLTGKLHRVGAKASADVEESGGAP